MNRIPLLIAAVLLPMAGCLGLPEGAVAPGDTVVVNVAAYDSATGELLMSNPQLTFVAGSGESDLGFEFERRLVGAAEGFEGTFRISNDPSLAWGDEVSVEGVFEDDLIGTIDTTQFEQFFGAPVVGETFNPQFSFYTFRVEAVENGTVTYRVMPEDGQEDAVPHLGAVLVTEVDLDRDVMLQTLTADVGATFEVQPPTPFNPNTPLGLAPGAYRAVGNEGNMIVYEYRAPGHPGLIGRDVRIEVSVVTVTAGAGQAVEPVDGNVGVRTSPYINGQPSSEVNYGPQSQS